MYFSIEIIKSVRYETLFLKCEQQILKYAYRYTSILPCDLSNNF